MQNCKYEKGKPPGWWLVTSCHSLSLSLSFSSICSRNCCSLLRGKEGPYTSITSPFLLGSFCTLTKRERDRDIQYVDVAFPRLFFFQSLPFFLFVHAVLKCKFRKGRSRVLKKAISSSSMSSLHVLLFQLWVQVCVPMKLDAAPRHCSHHRSL